MKLRRILLGVVSAAVSVALIILIIRIGNIDLHATWQDIARAKPSALVKLVLLNILLIWLSTEKWRSVDAALRHTSDPVPSWIDAFGFTSAGMALGQVLPVQLGMTAARTFGTHFYGSALKRGAAGTLFEQSFDVLIVGFLAVASAATWFLGGGGMMWLISAAAMIALELLAVGLLLRLAHWIASRLGRELANRNWLRGNLQSFFELVQSGVLSETLTRRLVILSAARFVVVVLMAEETAEAVAAPIPLWHLAAAVPFVYLAAAVAATPGGIGVNELTLAGALKMFGTRFSVAAPWVLVNRVLGVASCFFVALVAAILMGVKRLTSARAPLKNLAHTPPPSEISGATPESQAKGSVPRR
ncbi:MAG TPA: lysylphosphatidylglycerol synthase transmembrane domain-containing protein [Terriglobia bacterium]|nr:lysylphosphatidylglycerol synthase transmembrane domain-containing protein [Terriglobia bacterium]